MNYGQELILDLCDCDPSKFDREYLKVYFEGLCRRLKMRREDLHFWDYDDPQEKAAAPAHLKGTSAVQFITTSTIVIHTLDDLKRAYINVFSCKDFDIEMAVDYTKRFFYGQVSYQTVVERK
jgi:S-adenosylmethionine/arginine decarboxylase-like enzyme